MTDRTDRTYRQHWDLPAAVLEIPAVAKLAAEGDRLQAELQTTAAELDRATQNIDAAAEADRAAYAAAVRAAKGDPGTPASDQAAAHRADLERRYDALDVALRQTRSETLRAAVGHADKHQAKLTAHRDKKVQALRDAIAGLDGALEEVRAADTAVRWLQAVTESGAADLNVVRKFRKTGLTILPGLQTHRDAAPTTVESVLNALRELTDPPPPPERAPVTPLLPRVDHAPPPAAQLSASATVGR